MENILVLNGHEYYEHSRGELNKTMFDATVKLLEPHYNVKTTVLKDGFNKKEEQEKMLWADAVIYQTPIYNYSVPAVFKKYLDQTHEHGVYFRGKTKEYGIGGGLLEGKKYMFSTTWNAPAEAFNDRNKFFEGRNVEDVLFHLHLIHKYTGMKGLKTFSCFDVKKNPDIDFYKKDLKDHLSRYFQV
ncbi:NAD(P)H-dependent oxidoreductase [Pontibacillus sp. HMF3514]|uniref:NAD(P)H-dependent oxidoreductase n=1 Tax=Pontibacillus sp. HMF3514 TaxID=2692425 RepID=UPI00131FE03D|nr:NAD(P)H-dependent oxidoreductase [Pontibacillus sp. HMF3514]QHE52810.1 flavodoxin family protein [Pontibacillus sp. HMF3514]